MEIFKGDLREHHGLGKSLALTMGNFDGVHRGHLKLIERLNLAARERGLQSALLTFDPHPGSLLSNQKFTGLSTLEDRIRKLEKAGVEILFVQRFDESFAGISASSFVKDLIEPVLGPKSILLGYDFRFGRGGQGDIENFRSFYRGRGVPVEQFDSFRIQSEIVSSSRVRQKLKEGRVDLAALFLGEPYSFRGLVVKGDQMGRSFGFPTANLSGVRTMLPGRGVYWGHVNWGEQVFDAVLNIGFRPTLAADEERVEVHIIEFEGDLYGEELNVSLLGRLRDEKKFDSLEALKNQIREDVAKAHVLLRKR